MSSYPQIRYEYADESNSSQQSASVDPPLFLRPLSQQQNFEQFLHNCDDPAAPPFSPIGNFTGVEDDLFQQFNQQSSVTSFESSTTTTYWQPRLDDGSFENSQQINQGQQQSYQQSNSQISEQFDQFYDANHENFCNNPTIISITNVLHNQQSPHRQPFNQLHSVENTPLRSLNKSKQFSLSSNHQYKLEEEKELKNEVILKNRIKPKHILGPPAHWRLDEGSPEANCNNKRQRNVKNLLNVKIDGGDNNNDAELVDEESAEQSKELPVAPNGFTKPAYSYSCLIGLALKNSTTGELTVSEIYAFLCHHFPFFREAPSGWKNSVRHNLSLNKCFRKIEIEPPNSHGRKSCLWTMNPSRRSKMDHELKKWRERDEPGILIAMERPNELDEIQTGSIGMPPNLKPRRFSLPVTTNSDNQERLAFSLSCSSAPSSTNNDMPFALSKGAIKQRIFSVSQGPSFSNFNKSEALKLELQTPNIFPSNSSACHQPHTIRHRARSVHAQAARKLESLLHRQKTYTTTREETFDQQNDQNKE